MKAKISKEKREKKGLDYLKASKQDDCLVTEDGTVFTSDSERYAKSHAVALQTANEDCEGKILKIEAKGGKSTKDDKKSEDKKDDGKKDDKKSEDKKDDVKK